MPPRRPSRPSGFDRTAGYVYPDHLRAAVRDLPQAPGVYLFHGATEGWPLYIGKSVNIRSRVLSHLRNPQEARLLKQTTRIEHIRTAGEIGALLLEAQMVKERQPLMNQKLRRNRQLCAWHLDPEARPQLVYARDIDFAHQPDLVGLYASRHSALQGLRTLADTHRLCLGALGLERLAPGRGCFRAMVGQCAGVCCGRESEADHRARWLAALEALRIACWPWGSAIALVERYSPLAAPDVDPPEALTQWHVVRNWCYLGSAATLDQARGLDRVAAGFDADGYQILCKPVMAALAQSHSPGLEIVPL